MMSKALRSGTTADQFVETALDLIAETGGSIDVNLREIARRIGCAHTNLYNYFPDYPALLWEAFHRALARYADWLTEGLDESLTPPEYLRVAITNLATFPQTNPGLYRFIASDPMPTDDVPEDILETVGRMKTWLGRVILSGAESAIRPDQAAAIADVVLAYVDGETLNLINDRLVPGEDIAARIVDNALRLHRLLVADAQPTNTDDELESARSSYPTLDISIEHQGG